MQMMKNHMRAQLSISQRNDVHERSSAKIWTYLTLHKYVPHILITTYEVTYFAVVRIDTHFCT